MRSSLFITLVALLGLHGTAAAAGVAQAVSVARARSVIQPI
jgi:hypothetical protein